MKLVFLLDAEFFLLDKSKILHFLLQERLERDLEMIYLVSHLQNHSTEETGWCLASLHWRMALSPTPTTSSSPPARYRIYNSYIHIYNIYNSSIIYSVSVYCLLKITQLGKCSIENNLSLSLSSLPLSLPL